MSQTPSTCIPVEVFLFTVLTVFRSEGLVSKRKTSRDSLDHLTRTLNDLDELGEIMGEMLKMQDSVEVDCEESLASMSLQLETLDHLHQRYVLYQTAFNKLLLEIARRRHYKDSVEQFVKTMQDQLRSMVEGECSNTRTRSVS